MSAKSTFQPDSISSLPAGISRFLSCVLHRGFQTGIFSTEEFIRHFPPMSLMQGLREHSKTRARILTAATGTAPIIAERKTPESAGCDLQIALDADVVDAEAIVCLFGTDDCIVACDPRAIWAFIWEAGFWQTGVADDMAARNQISFMLELAFFENLLTREDVVSAIGVERMVEYLPNAQIVLMVERALHLGQSEKVFRHTDLMTHAPPASLAEHLPLEWLWEDVLIDRLAVNHGLLYASAPQHAPPPIPEAARVTAENPEVEEEPVASFSVDRVDASEWLDDSVADVHTFDDAVSRARLAHSSTAAS